MRKHFRPFIRRMRKTRKRNRPFFRVFDFCSFLFILIGFLFFHFFFVCYMAFREIAQEMTASPLQTLQQACVRSPLSFLLSLVFMGFILFFIGLFLFAIGQFYLGFYQLIGAYQEKIHTKRLLGVSVRYIALEVFVEKTLSLPVIFLLSALVEELIFRYFAPFVKRIFPVFKGDSMQLFVCFTVFLFLSSLILLRAFFKVKKRIERLAFQLFCE